MSPARPNAPTDMRPAPLVLPVALPEAAALEEVPDAEPELFAADLPAVEVALHILVSTDPYSKRRMRDSRGGRGSTTTGRCAAGSSSSLGRGTNGSSALSHGGVDTARAGAGGYSLEIRESGGTSAVLEDSGAKTRHQ